MNDETRHDSPGISRMEERLRTERAAASGLELDQLKMRALGQARRARPTNRRGQLMKSRLALLSMMVLGLLMSTTGATLAISGSSGSGSAGIAQYGREAPEEEGEEVLGDTEEQGTQPQGSDPQETLGDEAESESAPDTQEVQQVSAADDGESSLPFTGFLAVPLLIGGVALLGSGAVLRWKAKE